MHSGCFKCINRLTNPLMANWPNLDHFTVDKPYMDFKMWDHLQNLLTHLTLSLVTCSGKRGRKLVYKQATCLSSCWPLLDNFLQGELVVLPNAVGAVSLYLTLRTQQFGSIHNITIFTVNCRTKAQRP